MVVVMSEPVWPTRTSFLEALVSRTAPVSVSNGLIKMICHPPNAECNLKDEQRL